VTRSGDKGLWGDPSRDFDQFKFLKGEIVARYRKTAIAALAASALILTTSAASAREVNLNDIGGEAFKASSMSWAYFRGGLTDYTTTTPNIFEGARATAMMMGLNGESTFTLNIRGIDESAVGNEYPAHLHVGPCDANDPSAAGGHYNTDVIAGIGSPEVSEKTEVHLDFTVRETGTARVVVRVPFVPTVAPEGGSRSIVIHSSETSTRLACLPLDIKTLTSSR
jgi:Cu/Zn superoxide dismutase